MKEPPFRYRALALLSVAFGLIAYAGRGLWIADAFASNVAAGFIAALAAAVVIDRNAEHRQEETRRRLELVGLRQLRMPLVHTVELFASMIKASLPGAPSEPLKSYEALFAASMTDSLDWLKLSSSAGTVRNESWFALTGSTLKRTSEQISIVVDKYVAFLDPEFVEALEEMRDDAFFRLVAGIGGACDVVRVGGIKSEIALNGTKPLRDRFFAKLLRVVREYGRISGGPFPATSDFNRSDVAPFFGSSRYAALPPSMGIADALTPKPGETAHYIA